MSVNKILRLTSELELESLHIETAINTTDGRITKVSDESVVRGLIRGNVRTAKKALKDMALAVSHLFIDSSFGSALDTVADERGVAPRLTAAQSSTFVRIVASPGTTYVQGTNTVSDNKGNVFDLQGNITIGVKGFGYIGVRSQQSGASTNVDPYTVVNMSPQPTGHIGVINEYKATGGRDTEDDDTFRQRIKEGPDLLARDTLSYLNQAFININSNVLRTLYGGIDSNGRVVLLILTVNGIDLTTNELSTLLSGAASYLALTEFAAIGTTSYGVVLQNAQYYPIDLSMRIDLQPSQDLQTVVNTMQQKLSKFVDFRFWDSTKGAIQWTDLLAIAKNTDGVNAVPDSYFMPNIDIVVPVGQFPRFRGFVAYDLLGNLIIDQSGNLDPLFYANNVATDFSVTVL